MGKGVGICGRYLEELCDSAEIMSLRCNRNWDITFYLVLPVYVRIRGDVGGVAVEQRDDSQMRYCSR
jgi:hypothetical protein